MDISILHYHLNRGGVTQVIRNHLLALDEVAEAGQIDRVTLLHGPGKAGWPREFDSQLKHLDLVVAELPELAYDKDSMVLPQQLAAAIGRSLGAPTAGESVLHVHNHALGKTAALPEAMRLLAAEGWPLLLQVHDFAEDFRPSNYSHLRAAYGKLDPPKLARRLYPQASNIHYATLNGRDQNVFLQAGVEPSHLHWLANPVGKFEDLPPKALAREAMNAEFNVPLGARLALYPVRGIARKNLGEMLLWAAAGQGELWTATTLAPLNPKEMRRYRHWTSLADRLQLPVVFDCGGEEGLGFLVNLSAADVILTTSVAEGFGMVFLEAWLSGRTLAGRDLPEITADFLQAGVQLPGLTARVNVPVEWVGEGEFAAALADSFQAVAGEYGQTADIEALREQARQSIQDGNVDFAQLTPRLQSEVIERVASDAHSAAEFRRLNQTVTDALIKSPVENDGTVELIQHNASVIAEQFSLASIGQRLLQIYQQIGNDARSATEPTFTKLPEGERILQAFHDIGRYQPVRRNDAGD